MVASSRKPAAALVLVSVGEEVEPEGDVAVAPEEVVELVVEVVVSAVKLAGSR